MLLSLVAPGRDAPWRLPSARAGGGVGGGIQLSLPLSRPALLAGAACAALVALYALRSRRGRTFARVSDRHDGPESPYEDDELFGDDGDLPWGRTSMPATFERTDGTKVSSQVRP